VFLKRLEPAWVGVEGGQHVLLGIENLGQILLGPTATSELIVSMDGREIQCGNEFKTDGDMYIVDCLTPTFPSNTTLATVQVLYLQNIVCSGLLVVNGHIAKLSSFEKYSSDPNESFGPAVQYLSPVAYQSTAYVTQSIVEYGLPVRFVFEISSPVESGLLTTDIDVQLKPGTLSSCRPGPPSEDCRKFKDNSFNLSDISIQVTRPALLRASGRLDLFGCPTFFCGEGGWGVSFDATVFIKNKKIAERREVLRVVPVGSFSAVQVEPSIVPSLRTFPIATSINRFWSGPGGFPFQVEFQESDGAVTSGSVLKVEELPGAEYAKVVLLVPPFSAGPVTARIFYPGTIPQRSITMSTFRFFCLDDPPGPARVEWASTTSGPAGGGTEVKIRLTKFPMIYLETQVNNTCYLMMHFIVF
jgi:hypothetical protein